MKSPLLLAIDTSCDDTAAAVTRGSVVLSNIVASQTELHRPFGGVFPTVAKQAHRENIAPVIQKALQRAGVTPADIDAVVVTQGPGLAPALEVGITAAQEFATEYNKKLFSVNHLEGHVFSVLAQPNRKVADEVRPTFPVLSLVISGGNSLFVLIEGWNTYTVLGTKLDDAAGECLDKIGRMLNLGYPAGSVMENLAKVGNADRFPFPLPLTAVKTFDLSFSGLKTHARKVIEGLETKNALDRQTICDLCASAQAGVFRHITYKLEKILAQYTVGELWLGGGVAANVTLRKELRGVLRRSYQNRQVPLRVPYTKRLCMDNAAMIGVAAGFTLSHRTATKKIDRVPRLKLGEK